MTNIKSTLLGLLAGTAIATSAVAGDLVINFESFNLEVNPNSAEVLFTKHTISKSQ